MYLKKLIITIIALFFLNLMHAQETTTNQSFGVQTTQMPTWFMNSFMDLNEDIESLKEQNKRLMLFIEQDSCPYCHLFVTKNLQDEETKQLLQEHFGVLDVNMFGNKEMIDTDGEELIEKEFAKKHNIQFTPTIVFFDENSKQILRLNGYINIPQFKAALNYVKNKKEKELSFIEYMKKQSKNNIIKEDELFSKSKNFMRVESSKKMAIFFESSNCKECEFLHKKLLSDKTTKALLKQIDLFQIDMNSSKSVVTPNKLITKIEKWTKDLNINHTPTIIFFDNKGKEIIRVEAMFKNFHFQSIVDYVVSDAYKEEEEFQRFLIKRAATIRAKGMNVNIWD